MATHILAFEGDGHVEWFEGEVLREDYEEDKKRKLGIDFQRSPSASTTRSSGAEAQGAISFDRWEIGLIAASIAREQVEFFGLGLRADQEIGKNGRSRSAKSAVALEGRRSAVKTFVGERQPIDRQIRQRPIDLGPMSVDACDLREDDIVYE